MIITSKLAWYHLPKTAGTTTEKLFLSSGLDVLWNDDQGSALKHLPPCDHPQASALPLWNQHSIANFRRLPSWLLSNLQHKRKMMGLEVDDEPMRRGLFWRHRQQQWLPADWWLERLGVDESWTLLRVEYLKQDFLHCLRLKQPIELPARWRVRMVKSHNRNRYQRDLSDWFTAANFAEIYAMNPRWASLEQRLYGSLCTGKLE